MMRGNVKRSLDGGRNGVDEAPGNRPGVWMRDVFLVAYRSRFLLAKAAHRGSPHCVVTFDSYSETPDLDRRAFGEEFFARHGISTVHVVNGRNRWYHEPDWRRAMDAVRAATASYARVVTYGSSMGGYAALRFADHVGADACLALSPQYSRDPKKVPFEDRWKPHRRGKWLPELSGPLAGNIPAVVVYDSAMRAERRHVELIAGDMPVQRLALPHAGHPAGTYLLECGVLEELVLGVARGEIDLASLRRRARSNRRRSAQYHLAMSYAVGPGRRTTAIQLARRATEIAPGAAHTWHHLGRHLDKAVRRDEALDAHRKASELAPEVIGLRVAYAKAQEAAGDRAGALATMAEAAGSPCTPEIRRRIRWLALDMRLRQQLARLRAALQA